MVQMRKPVLSLMGIVLSGSLFMLLAFGPPALGNTSGQTTEPGETMVPCSPRIDISATFIGGAQEDADVARVNALIEKTFNAALQQLQTSPPADRLHSIQLLGKLTLFDKNLSVNRNIACSSCHVPDAGYTSGVSLYNRTIVAQPGSVPITNAQGSGPNRRISPRKPLTYSYAPFAQFLHFNATQGDFYGGNFWDMRATGIKLDNPATAQAKGPPMNPVEMGFSDPACAVYRISQSEYRSFFEKIWGAHTFAINWPDDIETVCSTPGPAPADNPLPVRLNPVDRGIASDTYDHMAMAMAAYEASPDVSPFSSKFDYALANPDKHVLSYKELAGWQLFRTKGKCNTCHLDGTQNQQNDFSHWRDMIKPADASDVAPLFTDFTSSNLGLPKNLALPFYCEDSPDQFGFTANPEGQDFTDLGVGEFLRSANNPNKDWEQYAGQFDGAFRVPTLRNVDMRPRPDFVKAYMHNGYLKSLKEVVHFYNTRDVLPECPQGSPGEKVTCWPPSEVPENIDQTVGDLGLSDTEEDLMVIFLKTLTDGYQP